MGSLANLVQYAEAEAIRHRTWYWKHKAGKARWSRFIQLVAMILTALAGIFPVVVYIFKPVEIDAGQTGLWSSFFVGVAAALIAIDRTFGLSSSWTRYVLTATSIERLLEEFRMDCALMLCKADPVATPEQLRELVERTKEFRIAVQNLVIDETKAWATEFQTNIGRSERELQEQIVALKSQREKFDQQSSQAPGSIDLSITNASQAEGCRIALSLEGKNGKASQYAVEGNRWVALDVAPGLYRILLQAVVEGKPVNLPMAISVRSGEITKAELSLPS